MLKRILLLAAIVALIGCSTHFENEPLTQSTANSERRSVDVSDKNRPVILVAISGGGARASALGWEVLRELKNFIYTSHGETRRLIDDVVMVSSVSGGSVIAAYYGLYGPEGLDQFEPDFLTTNNMKTLVLNAASPPTWLELAINGEGRTDLVEEMFDNQLFHNKTFADLNQPGKPIIILNATDMASGEVFSLTPDRFNDICSDFDKLPISTGVAASADVPIVLSPIAFKNYSTTHCSGRPLPKWITTALRGYYEPYINLEEFKRARYANDLRRGPDRFRDIQYIYLVDGGVADNLGVHGLLNAVSSTHGTGQILNHINQGDIGKLVVIVINARSDKPNSAYESPTRPGLWGMALSVASASIDSTTASVNSQMEDLLNEIRTAADNAPKDARFGGIKVYSVQVDMDQLRVGDDEQRSLRDKVKSIQTTWNINAEDRDTVKAVGQLLLRQHPCFQRLLLDLKIREPFVDREFAKNGCSP